MTNNEALNKNEITNQLSRQYQEMKNFYGLGFRPSLYARSSVILELFGDKNNLQLDGDTIPIVVDNTIAENKVNYGVFSSAIYILDEKLFREQAEIIKRRVINA